MKEEDKIVNYRPCLALILQKAMEFAQDLYSLNFQKAYYMMLSSVYEKEDPEYAKILKEAAHCFDEKEIFGIEKFHEYYEKEYGLEYVSEPRAAFFVFNIFGDSFDKVYRKQIDFQTLTKSEQYMVDSFFRKLEAPMRNPNIEIPEGYTQCYYDRERWSDFHKDLERSLDYIKRECQIPIDIFMTPDEQEKDCKENKSENEVELPEEEIEKD